MNPCLQSTQRVLAGISQQEDTTKGMDRHKRSSTAKIYIVRKKGVSMFCPVSMHLATDNHLRVQAWLVVLKPAAEEVKVLLVETLPRQSQVSKDSQFPKHHIFILEI